jgi:dihydrofolate reductase
VDDDMAARAMSGLGAWILGRNMFGPIRGPWPDESWKGWWGDEPPYHVPVFVLTHHARAPIPMAGGTEFRFVTGGIEDAPRQARAAAGRGERVLEGIDMRALGYEVVEHVPGSRAVAHVFLRRRG